MYLKGISNGEIGEALGQEAKEIAAGVARGVAGFEGTWDERAEVCGWRRLRGFKQLGKVIERLPTICQQLLRGYNPAIKFQLNAMRRVHVLGNLDQNSVGL